MAILDRAVRNARAMMRAGEWGSSSQIPPNSAAPSLSVEGAGSEAAALGISTVLACTKALHDDMRTLKFAAYEGDPLGAREPLSKQPLCITEPFGPDLEPDAGFGQLVVSYAMRGRGFGFTTHRDPKTGLTDQMVVLHPDAVRVHVKDGRKAFRIGGQDYTSKDVVHITGMMLPGAVDGVDVLTVQRINFDLAMKVGAYAAGFFGNGGSPSGVISVPGQGDRRKAREVRDIWESAHAGVNNAHRPAVMFGGAQWQALTVTPENAQFLETRRFLREEICGIYGVPLQRIQAIVQNASQGGGKGLDAIDAGYVKHGLLPVATAIEKVWNRLIPGGNGSWTMFDFDTFLRASAEIRARVALDHRVTGVRTIDEIRASEGWAPLPDGQGTDPFTPLNSNTSPTGGADNEPNPGGQTGGQGGL